ncbi:MAG: hypothetical protein K8T20_06665 [Planctomycetes bacterium]|nr:hypothetical protein [Planctomycetota bacterium]
MRRFVVLGGWYALLFAASLLADTGKDAEYEGDDLATVKAGDMLEPTGKTSEGYVEVKMGGKTGWISNSDLFTVKEQENLAKTSGAGGNAVAGANEGAFVKGFDPEVEGKMREDHPDLDQIFKDEIFPWVWTVRGGVKEGYQASSELETVEEAQEKLLIQGKPDEAAKLQPQIDALRLKVQPYRDRWQAELRQFRQAGKVGEFAVRK